MAKNISIKLSDVKSYLSAASKNLGWAFFIIFLILLVFEGLEVKTSLEIVSELNQQPPVAVQHRGVKIDFVTYQQIVQRLQNAQNFQPTGGIDYDPFNDMVVTPSVPVAASASSTPVSSSTP